MNRDEQLGKIIREIFQEVASGVEITPDKVQMVVGDSPELVAETESLIEIIDGLQAPWVIEAYKWEGLHEGDDREELEAFMGVNPDGEEGGVAWCAYFIEAVMKACDIEGANSGLAADWATWGTECEARDGAIAVYDGHIGICIGDGIFGGNQGQMARLNKRRVWFDKNRTLLGYRCPPGFVFKDAA